MVEIMVGWSQRKIKMKRKEKGPNDEVRKTGAEDPRLTIGRTATSTEGTRLQEEIIPKKNVVIK